MLLCVAMNGQDAPAADVYTFGAIVKEETIDTDERRWVHSPEWSSSLDSSVQCKHRRHIYLEETVDAFCKFHGANPRLDDLQQPGKLILPGMFLVAAVECQMPATGPTGELLLSCEPCKTKRESFTRKLSPLNPRNVRLRKDNVLLMSKDDAAGWLNPIPYHYEHVGNVMWDETGLEFAATTSLPRLRRV